MSGAGDETALDRPVWSSLTTSHTHLAQGDGRALRYRPEVNVFVSPADDGGKALAAAAALIASGDRGYIVQAELAPELPGLTVVLRRPLVQMVFAGSLPAQGPDAGIVPLNESDAEDRKSVV